MTLQTLLTAVLLLPAMVLAADHPRLLFSKKDIPELRKRITKEPYKSMYEHLVKTADYNHWGREPIQDGDDYSQQTAMHRNAFLYVLTGDDKWAKKAREYAELRLADERVIANPRTKGLTLYTTGAYLALAYDYCFDAPSWDPAFRDKMSKTLKAQGDVIVQKGGSEQNRSAASNWQGLRWSTGGLCYLATDEPIDAKALDLCFRNTSTFLKANLGTGGSGWNCEGLGYTFYPMGNGVLPFGIAMHRADPSRDIRKSTPAAPFALWTCYAPIVRNATGMWRPDFADDNPGTNFEGTLGFAFWMSPKELHPGMKCVYDRLVGLEGDKTFDASRFGTVASILYYPDDVKEKDPMTLPAWVQLFADTKGNGLFTFRNTYGTPDDLCVQIFAKLIGNRGHNGPDSLSYRIYGFDGLWGVGGGRYGPKLNGQDAYQRSMNTLYPLDPDQPFRTNGDRGQIVGHAINKDGSGWVTMSAPQNNVGTKNHVRRFYVTFDKSTGAQCAIVIVDTSDNGTHFQHCAIQTHPITTDKNTFTITGPTENTLVGTVVFPAGTTLSTGTRMRGSDAGEWTDNNFVTATAEGGNIVTVLTLQQKGTPPPKVEAKGDWSGKDPKGTITIGKKTIKLTGDKFAD